MPAEQRGQPYKLGPGRWGLRYYDAAGARKRKSGFASRSAALAYYRDVIRPQFLGLPVADPDMTLAELVDVFLERHAAVRSPGTIAALRGWLRRPLKLYGSTTLRELERMSGDLASFASRLPPRYRFSVMRAMRQVCAAGVRWGYLTKNPAALAGPNPMPAPRAIRVYTRDELDALEAELGPRYGPMIAFAAATGLRPAEWARAERRDVDRERKLLDVRGTKTRASRRQVPLSSLALGALDRLPPRIDSPLLFPGHRGKAIDLHNFSNREWRPAVEASGVATPARLYDLRCTFASNALAVGVTPFELARIMGTSIAMIERSYGTLIGGAGDSIAARLDQAERLGQERATAEQEG